MDIKEQAAFYKRLSQFGFTIWDENGSFLVDKRPTAVADYGLADVKKFDNEELAIEYVKTVMKWEWVAAPEDSPMAVLAVIEDEPEPIIRRFDSSILYNVGYGLQTIGLGVLASKCDDENWYFDLGEQAKVLAKVYFEKHFPDVDLEKVSYQIKLIPKAL